MGDEADADWQDGLVEWGIEDTRGRYHDLLRKTVRTSPFRNRKKKRRSKGDCMTAEKRIVHCWADGPETEDGCSTTCMLLDGHEGPHEWDRDDEIGVSFAPALSESEEPHER